MKTPILTLSQLLPQWLVRRFRKPATQPVTTLKKEDAKALPIASKPASPLTRWQDDDSPAGYRILWKL